MSREKKENRTSTREILRMVAGIRKSFLPLMILEQMVASAILYLNIIVGAMILDGVAEAAGTARGGMAGSSAMEAVEQHLIRLAVGLVLLNMVLALLRWGLNKGLIVLRRRVDEEINKKVSEKCLTLDYQILERTDTLDHVESALRGSQMNGGITSYCSTISGRLGNIVAIVYSVILISRLFLDRDGGEGGGLVAFACSLPGELLMVFLIAGTVFVRFLVSRTARQMQYRMYEKNVRVNRRFDAYFMFMYEYSPGKQVRIYDMARMIIRGVRGEAARLRKSQKGVLRREAGMSAATDLIMGILLFACYGFVGIRAVGGAVSIGEVSLYVGVLTSFSDNVSEFFGAFNWLEVMNQYMGNFTSLLSLKNEKYEGTLPIEKRLDNEYELEFNNVSFHYPNNEELVLKNITAKIHVGRKLAIVGKNGSGKSTFIKLLCRLYDPTEGEILLNGIDIRKYDYDEYRQIFGVVFQDFRLFSFPVAQNVAASTEYDEQKVWHALRQAGMEERVREMTDGMDTVLYKQGEEGVEISGGEAQKLAIARALYRDAPVVILDEPTAALDPVSELEIYERFDEMVEHKTAIYISHRMSSCRFCENILVFDGGDIIQMGSHDDLAESGGLYQELWEAQAQYYKD